MMQTLKFHQATMQTIQRVGRQIERLADSVETLAAAVEAHEPDGVVLDEQEADGAREWLVWAAEEAGSGRRGPTNAERDDLDAALDALEDDLE